jgi:SAM-dependent methyltransferase
MGSTPKLSCSREKDEGVLDLIAETKTGPKDAGLNRQYFDGRYSAERESVPNFLDSIISGGLASFLAERCRGRILVDIGCGKGLFARAASTYFVVYAFDLSAQAVRLIPNSITVKWIGTAGAIPLHGNSVDLVTCLDVVEHLLDPQACIAEAFRILRDDGLFFIRTPNPESLGLRMKGSRWFGFRDPTHITIESFDDWKRRLRNGGFDILEEGTNLLSDPPYIFAADNRPEKLFFQGTNLLAMLVKPYLPWIRGENIHVLAKKQATVKV